MIRVVNDLYRLRRKDTSVKVAFEAVKLTLVPKDGAGNG